MFPNNARIGCLERTILTGYRFFAGMLSQMDRMRYLSGRLVTAHIAYERFDLIVHGFDVLRQHLRIGEQIVAMFAFLLRIPTHLGAVVLVMCDAVHSQLRELFEDFRTIRTGESFRRAVDL